MSTLDDTDSDAFPGAANLTSSPTCANTLPDMFSGPHFGDMTPSQSSVTENHSSGHATSPRVSKAGSKYVFPDYSILQSRTSSSSLSAGRTYDREDQEDITPPSHMSTSLNVDPKNAKLSQVSDFVRDEAEELVIAVRAPDSMDPDILYLTSNQHSNDFPKHMESSTATNQSLGDIQDLKPETGSQCDTDQGVSEPGVISPESVDGEDQPDQSITYEQSDSRTQDTFVWDPAYEDHDLPTSSPPLDPTSSPLLNPVSSPPLGPSSSPPLDPISSPRSYLVSSPPPTSSPHIFSSPCLSSQPSESTIPEINLDPVIDLNEVRKSELLAEDTPLLASSRAADALSSLFEDQHASLLSVSLPFPFASNVLRSNSDKNAPQEMQVLSSDGIPLPNSNSITLSSPSSSLSPNLTSQEQDSLPTLVPQPSSPLPSPIAVSSNDIRSPSPNPITSSPLSSSSNFFLQEYGSLPASTPRSSSPLPYPKTSSDLIPSPVASDLSHSWSLDPPSSSSHGSTIKPDAEALSSTPHKDDEPKPDNLSGPPNALPEAEKTLNSRLPLTPAPKRPTFASQNKTYKKLATPFRPPVMTVPKKEDYAKPAMTVVAFTATPTPRATLLPASTKPSPDLQALKAKENEKRNAFVSDKKKHRTVRAGAQFKSPLTAAAAASAGKSSIRLTPSIQMLERKVQLLKRAVKVKNEQEEETLKDLIKTWTEAGREVSYELFELAREREGSAPASGGSWGGGGIRKFEDSWGWSTQEGAKRVKTEDVDGNWGWTTSDSTMSEGGQEVEVIDADEEPEPDAKDDYEEEDKPEATIGTMLRQLGVDPNIFGWDDNESTFVDK
ncbi:hypothetical protein V5O48_000005 [Marasmius crinis-equi]|uniref:Uncharacterized protein n=1 Tax=Marasmius crinis-equi TaxID=585013 RepID=A0ABR3G2A9_9AGAR